MQSPHKESAVHTMDENVNYWRTCSTLLCSPAHQSLPWRIQESWGLGTTSTSPSPPRPATNNEPQLQWQMLLLQLHVHLFNTLKAPPGAPTPPQSLVWGGPQLAAWAGCGEDSQEPRSPARLQQCKPRLLKKSLPVAQNLALPETTTGTYVCLSKRLHSSALVKLLTNKSAHRFLAGS